MVGYIIGAISAICINAIFANQMKKVAIRKGYGDDTPVWVMCFFLGLLGGIYTLALPDLILQAQNKKIIELLERDK